MLVFNSSLLQSISGKIIFLKIYGPFLFLIDRKLNLLPTDMKEKYFCGVALF